jgi:hypothetical protein
MDGKTWAELEVSVQKVAFGSAADVKYEGEPIEPGSEGEATIKWRLLYRKEEPQKDHSLKVTYVLNVEKAEITKIVVKAPDPQLPGLETGSNRKKRAKKGPAGADVATAGQAVDGVVADLKKKRAAKSGVRATRRPKKV